MNYTVITDIFGNKISRGEENNNFLPFILIHSVQPHLVIEKIEKMDDSVWELVKPTIMHILYYHRLNSTNFSPLGHIWLSKSTLPTKITIILVNTKDNISKYPINYVNIGRFGKTNIWRPISQRGFTALGYLASSKKPSLKEIKTVNNDLVTLFRGKDIVVGSNTNMNEFNLLSFVGEKKFTIKRSSLIGRNNIIKLYSKIARKYLTGNNDDTITLNNNMNIKNDSMQNINYTTQGELKMGNKCVSISDFDESLISGHVHLDNCDGSEKQKWYPHRDSIISEYDQTCLTAIDDDKIVRAECDFKRNNQKWFVEDQETVIEDKLQETNDLWRTYSGKKVKLIESDNPWYINKKGKKPEGIIRQKRIELNKKDYKSAANFHSTFMMDVHRPNMGYGYSYVDRKGKQCLCLEDCEKTSDNMKFAVLENFETNKLNKNSDINRDVYCNTVACSLLLLVILLVIFRIYTKYRR